MDNSVWTEIKWTGGGVLPPFGVCVPTGAYDPATGALIVTTATVDNDASFLANGSTSVASGELGNATVDPRVTVNCDSADGAPVVRDSWGVKSGSAKFRKGYSGVVIQGVGDGSGIADAVRSPKILAGPGPDSPCGGCDWFAGATRYGCWTLTVLSATGSMVGLDISQVLLMEWVSAGSGGGGCWVSTTNFIFCGHTGTVRLCRNADGEPSLYFDAPGYMLTLGCCDRDARSITFGAGNSGETILCDYTPDTSCPPHGPDFDLMRVKVTWRQCINPDWDGPGWYCVGVPDCEIGSDTTCVLYTCDPGPTVSICSGPHATEEECVEACGQWYCVADPDCDDPEATYSCVKFDTPPDPEDPTICSGPYVSEIDCLASGCAPPPIPPELACCEGVILPGRLYGTFDGVPVVLDYQSPSGPYPNGRWISRDAFLICGVLFEADLTCLYDPEHPEIPSGWALTVKAIFPYACVGGWNIPATEASCSPFFADGGATTVSGDCCPVGTTHTFSISEIPP